MAFTGNATYTGLAAFTIEQTIQRDWSLVWVSAYPFLKILDMDKSNFNRGFSVSGLKMLLSVMGDDLTNPAEGVLDNAETTPMTANTTNGFSQFAFNFAHYRGNYTITESEATLAANGGRGDLLEGKKIQFLNSFKTKLSTHVAGSAIDARNSVLGMGQPLSTSNTVGGISQSTDTLIAAQVLTGYGPFSLSAIDVIADSIGALDRKEADMVFAAHGNGSTTNVYAKIRDQIGPSERFENTNDFAVKYGIKSMVYGGLPIIRDNRITGGTLRVIASKSWYAYFPKKPKLLPLKQIDLTDAFNQMGTMWAALGTNDPACNGLVSGIT